MSTIRIFQNNPYQKHTEAVVTSISEKNGFEVITVDQTVFFPTGGGQNGDIGTVSCADKVFKVTDTFDDNLESPVYHQTDAPSGTFEVGDRIDLTLDWKSRFSNMQRHTGEHMLSGIFYNMYGGVNKGFHMSGDYIAIDIDLEGRILSSDEIADAEQAVNELIWEDVPVRTTWFDSYEESLVMPVRKQAPHEGRISVVTIGNDGDIRDCIACCGTHVSSTGQVGLIKVMKSEPSRGMTRVYFDCGANAFACVRADHDVVTEISADFSCGRDDLKKNINVMKDRTDALKRKLSELTELASEHEYAKIKTKLFESSGARGIISASSSHLDTDALLKLGFRLSESLSEGQILALEATDPVTVLLFSADSTLSCGTLVKENVGDFGGRGGGRPDNARAAFKSSADAQAFIKRLGEIVL